MAHRLHQRQGIYRFNLYNECNLLLSTTCSSADMDLAMACRDQTQGGSQISVPACTQSVHVQYVGGRVMCGG